EHQQLSCPRPSPTSRYLKTFVWVGLQQVLTGQSPQRREAVCQEANGNIKKEIQRNRHGGFGVMRQWAPG
ncbi:L-galactono-14-lactone dehydrogenase 2 mitochondrial, partial [Dissostichus eleginoides]